MNSEFFGNANQLIKVFNINQRSVKYTDLTPLKDRKVAFEIRRQYPQDIRFKPPVDTNNSPDIIAIISVVYEHPEELEESVSVDKVPITLTINSYSRYLSNHRDYNYSDRECPTELSLKKSKKTPRPMSLFSIKEYFLNHNTNKFHDSKNKEITGENILDTLFKEHCDTVHFIKGFILRFRLRTINLVSNICVSLCDIFILFFEWILKIAFGRTFESSNFSAGILDPYKREDMRLLNTESFNILGYKGSKNVIITFCFIVFLSAILKFYFKVNMFFITPFIKYISDNVLLMTCSLICFLFILEHLFPLLIFYIINGFITIRSSVMFKRLKI